MILAATTSFPTSSDFRAELTNRFGEGVRFDEPLARHAAYRIGGPADALLEVEDVSDLRDALQIARSCDEPTFVLGTGANILISDRGVRGLVLRLGRSFSKVTWAIEGNHARVHAGAAVPFKKLVVDAVERGFSGLEFGEGIPGSLGGGIVMNAGAFGGEIGRVVEAIEGLDGNGRERAFSREELAFGYRRLDLPVGFTIASVRLGLERGDAETLRERVTNLRSRRKKAQPLGFPNCGSVFKNPEGAFAGKLLDEAGVKGLRRGSARVSEAHANFVVNEGGATADDVRQLFEEMERRVLERTGIQLEREVILVGQW